ncbi:unnamed protein product [Rangifer tarandus platyrhynchus]|uniref:Uncharacterized protein n=1 Tax=Rangifer tarandus platyrhynchus TaxID=3082113 RepID=A0ABN8Z1Q1_RANTA|nr:unnamed protein product [Rangifer tarandus platyrhynchus]
MLKQQVKLYPSVLGLLQQTTSLGPVYSRNGSLPVLEPEIHVKTEFRKFSHLARFPSSSGAGFEYRSATVSRAKNSDRPTSEGLPGEPFTEGPLSPDLASAGQGLAFHVDKWRECRLDGELSAKDKGRQSVLLAEGARSCGESLTSAACTLPGPSASCLPSWKGPQGCDLGVGLSNELERQLGTRSLPRDPGSLEPERRGHQGLEGGPGPPLEQDTGLRRLCSETRSLDERLPEEGRGRYPVLTSLGYTLSSLRSGSWCSMGSQIWAQNLASTGCFDLVTSRRNSEDAQLTESEGQQLAWPVRGRTPLLPAPWVLRAALVGLPGERRRRLPPCQRALRAWYRVSFKGPATRPPRLRLQQKRVSVSQLGSDPQDLKAPWTMGVPHRGIGAPRGLARAVQRSRLLPLSAGREARLEKPMAQALGMKVPWQGSHTSRSPPQSSWPQDTGWQGTETDKACPPSETVGLSRKQWETDLGGLGIRMARGLSVSVPLSLALPSSSYSPDPLSGALLRLAAPNADLILPAMCRVFGMA